jgi:hypothetical protein
MTTTLNADDGVVSGSAGLKYSSDGSGVLALQTNGTTAVSISTGQVVTFTNPPTGVFPSGTALLFQQTTAPTGWTKSTTHNDKALRVVSGSASSGGSVAFTTAFASQAVAGTVGTSGATTLSTAQIPSHSHTAPSVVLWGAAVTGTPNLFCGTTTAANSGTPTSTYYGPNTGAAGGGGSHDHSGGTFTGTAINLAVQYVDVIIATKD